MKNIISVRGARTHNLKNIDVDIKQNAITCLCGPSGSGKTSLAFHTLLTESKRRFINSFPTDIKFFWDIPHTVDVDKIYPVLPVWGLAQHNPVVGSRPTVLDLMGGFDDLARIFFQEGALLCPVHHVVLKELGPEQLISKAATTYQFVEGESLHFLISSSEYIRCFGEEFRPSRSYSEEFGVRAFDSSDELWEVFRVKWGKIESINKKLRELSSDILNSFFIYSTSQKRLTPIETKQSEECPTCGFKDFKKIDSEFHLSPYNALGACSDCNGYGMNLVYDPKRLVKNQKISLSEGAVSFLNYKRFEHLRPVMLKEAKKEGFDLNRPFEQLDDVIWPFLYDGKGSYPGFNSLFKYLESKRYKSTVRIFIRSLQSEEVCHSCHGSRLDKHAHKRSLVTDDEFIEMGDLCLLPIDEAYDELCDWEGVLDLTELSRLSFKRLKKKLKVAIDLGVGHLSLSRRVKTLSAGEYQRTLLNKFLSFQGSGSLFIFDEPSLGLGIEEQKVLFRHIDKLKKQDNTVLLVDHSECMQKLSDEVIEMGPGPGHKGGEIVYQGKYIQRKNKLNGLRPPKLSRVEHMKFSVAARDFEEVSITLPSRGIVWAKGKSGSGKTTYLVEAIGNKLAEISNSDDLLPQKHICVSKTDIAPFKKVVLISGNAMKTNSRSTVGTFLGISPYLRKHYASLPTSRSMGLRDGHFSSNSELGKCQSCEGRGVRTVEMSFMEDVEFVCEDCNGMKLKPLYAQISDGQRTYFESSHGPIDLLFEQLSLTPKLRRLRDLFTKLNLNYLSVDRPLASLSGGERQRLKFLSELHTGLENSALFFENISFGLSWRELHGICDLLQSLGGRDNLLVIIDQNEEFKNIANFSMTFSRPGQAPKLL